MLSRRPARRRDRDTLPRDRSGAFVNWAATVHSRPVRWELPGSEADISNLISRAVDTGERITMVGAGHSWSSVAAPERLALSLDRFVGIAAYDDHDPASGLPRTVTVRAGTRVGALHDELAARGLALPILGSVVTQSVAGAIGTGTHGSSLLHGSLSGLVTGMRLITGTGATRDLDESAEGHERLDGARVHLGALGVVTRVSLRVVPAFLLARRTERVLVTELAARLQEIGDSAEYVKVWWLPHTSHAIVFRCARTDEPASRRPSAHTEQTIAEHVHKALLRPAFAVQERWPAAAVPYNRAVARALAVPRRVGPSRIILTTPNPIRHDETEASVPLSKAPEAVERLRELFDTTGVRANFIVELRYAPAETGWLAPAHGAPTMHIGAYSALRAHWQRYYDAFWERFDDLDARPHWGKGMHHDADRLRALYPDTFARFTALRDELDPHHVFTNAFLDRALS
jgi:FAD/FMN-containing dehydrogenase